MIAWLVDAAAIVSQKALLKCSYAPYARIMKKICWEESFHILHGRDVILALVTGTEHQRELLQEALTRWWEPLMMFHGNPIPADDDPMVTWRIKSQANEDARQQFLDGYVPQIWELGLTVPDPKLRQGDDGVWEYTEPDYEKLMAVVSGHGPASRRAARVPAALTRRRGVGVAGRARGGGVMVFEVFRQERKGQAFAHAGRDHGARRGVRGDLRPRAVRAAPGVGRALARAARGRSARSTSSPTSSTSSTAASTATRSRPGSGRRGSVPERSRLT